MSLLRQHALPWIQVETSWLCRIHCPTEIYFIFAGRKSHVMRGFLYLAGSWTCWASLTNFSPSFSVISSFLPFLARLTTLTDINSKLPTHFQWDGSSTGPSWATSQLWKIWKEHSLLHNAFNSNVSWPWLDSRCRFCRERSTGQWDLPAMPAKQRSFPSSLAFCRRAREHQFQEPSSSLKYNQLIPSPSSLLLKKASQLKRIWPALFLMCGL